ncbi:TRAP transporter small permease subunit [Dehalococcoidia bacterium]|nr:TRAP transporter small permease subunit [Dehalococcoidia bacterium]
MKKLNAVLKAIDKISEVTGKCASWLMIVVTLIILYEVIARTVFGAPTVWAFELSIMLWGTYFVSVMAWTHKEGGHIAVDVIYNWFSTRRGLISPPPPGSYQSAPAHRGTLRYIH